LQHDIAKPHISVSTLAGIEKIGFEFIEHPPYSSDLAPSDFRLFPKLKYHLKGIHFQNDEKMKADVRK